MEVIIKSPLIGDEIVVWPSEEKLLVAGAGVSAIDKEEVDIPKEPQVETLAINQSLPYTSEVSPAETEQIEPGLQSSYQLNAARLIELEQEAAKTGYERGFTEGEADARLKFSESIGLLQSALEDLRKLEYQVFVRAERIIGAIVFEAVSKIIGTQLQTEEGRKEAISQAIRAVESTALVKIRVSPQDFEYMKNCNEEIANLPLEADSSIELGGCIVELAEGSIDARIENQFRIFAQSIKEAAGHV